MIGYTKRKYCAGCDDTDFLSVLSLGEVPLAGVFPLKEELEIENKLGATNFSYSPNKALDISGFAIYNLSNIGSKQTSFKQYTDSDLGIPDEATAQTSDERSKQMLLKLSTSYKPNASNQLDYDILGRISKDEQQQNYVSSVIGATDQFEETTPFSINQNINYYGCNNINQVVFSS